MGRDRAPRRNAWVWVWWGFGGDAKPAYVLSRVIPVTMAPNSPQQMNEMLAILASFAV